MSNLDPAHAAADDIGAYSALGDGFMGLDLTLSLVLRHHRSLRHHLFLAHDDLRLLSRRQGRSYASHLVILERALGFFTPDLNLLEMGDELFRG